VRGPGFVSEPGFSIAIDRDFFEVL